MSMNCSGRARPMAARCGNTLLELLVAIVILVLIGGIALSAGHAPSIAPSAADGPAVMLSAARRRAIGTRAPVTIVLDSAGTRSMATAWPDGTVSTDSTLHLSPFNGADRDAAR